MKLCQQTAGAISEGAKTLSNSKPKFKKKLKTILIISLKYILNLILGELVGRERPKICQISNFQFFLDDLRSKKYFEVNLCSSKASFKKKKQGGKEGYQPEESCEMVVCLFLGAVVGRAPQNQLNINFKNLVG